MADILDVAGHKLATIGEDGRVRNLENVIIGSVDDTGQVYNNMATVVGNFGANGYVYKAGSHFGTVHGDGRVYDYENRWIGKVVGDHIESGGAALLLLIL
jgi:hypothetical protein